MYKNRDSRSGPPHETEEVETVLVRGARQLLTLRNSSSPRRGAALSDLGIIHDGAVLIRAGKVVESGPSRRLENVAKARGAHEIDATGRVVLPGFVDGCTQLLSPRTPALSAREEGIKSGFRRDLRELSATPVRRLRARAQVLLAGMARHGTTTVSALVHHGSNRLSELKALRVLAGLDGKPLDLIRGYYGAQFVPPELSEEPWAYAESVCNKTLPLLARRNLARFVGVNCRVSELSAARRILACAKELGFGLRLYAGANTAAVRLAIEMEASSLSLDSIEPGEIGALARARTIALLAPASVLSRRLDRYPPARALIDSGAAVALASGYGLAQSPTYNMQMVIALACSQMGMSPAEAICAATANAAHALGCADRAGSLQPGRRADILLLNVQDYRDIGHHFGINHVHMVLKNGVTIYKEGEVAVGSANS